VDRTIAALGLAMTVGALLGAAVTRAAEPLRVGVATVEITPPLGYRMSGYFRERRATAVHDPLQAKALVFRQGDVKAAVVLCDLIGLPRRLSERARRAAAEATGIPPAHLVLGATHTHTGPLYFGVLRDLFHERAVAAAGSDPAEGVDYPARLRDRIVEAVTAAAQAARPATLLAGRARVEGLAFNRRYHMKDGSVRFNPGMRNPNIVRPAGPVDPEVGVLAVRRHGDERPRAALVNFALHLDTVGGTAFGADYPFYTEHALRRTWGPDFALLFGIGCAGDINHVDFPRGVRPGAETIGRRLAEAVAGAPLAPVAEPALAVAREVLRLPLQEVSDEEAAWAKANIEKVGTRDLSFLDQVRAYKVIDLLRRRAEAPDGRTMPVEVQVVRLSRRVALVALPGEVFVELGLAIKRASPFEVTLVLELCQDAPGYIPTTKAFREGSYETVNSRLAPGAGERMVETAVRLLTELASR